MNIIEMNGSYGVADNDKNIIIPCEYEHITDKGDNHYLCYKDDYYDSYVGDYFIERHVKVDGKYKSTDDNMFAILEVTDKDNGDFSCIRNGLAMKRTFSTPVQIRKLFDKCERLKAPQNVLDAMFWRWTWDFSCTIVRFTNGNIDKGIKQMEQAKFIWSWYYIDAFWTNEETLIADSEFVKLKRYYESDGMDSGDKPRYPCPFIYGIDNSLKDGEVKWLHLSFFSEGDDDNGDSMIGHYVGECYYDDMMRYIESLEWKEGEWGGDFFNMYNIRYTTNRPWSETEKVLNELAKHGQKPDFHEIVDSYLWGGWHDSQCHKNRERQFYAKFLLWAFENNCGKLNCIIHGQTMLDLLMTDEIPDFSKNASKMRSKLIRVARSKGAMTAQEYRVKEDIAIKHCIPLNTLLNNIL